MKLYIGESLKQLRGKKKMTQAQLADVLGVSYQAVSRWENDSAYPDIELLPELAAFFGVTLEELLGCKNNEQLAEQTASELQERIFSARITDPQSREELLNKLRELVQQYPNNSQIKICLVEALLSTCPESYDEILPEIRRYANAALEAFPMDGYQNALYFIRYMVIAASENEVDEWASLLPVYDMNLRWNVLRIRYQERGEWEKARHCESHRMLLNLRDLTSCGPITGDNLKGALLATRHAERIYDGAIGTPYMGKDGKVHNSICLYERINHLLTSVLVYLGEEYSTDTEEDLTNGFAALKKAVDYAILYADAVKEPFFTSDNPYFEPQKVGDHPYMDVGEQSALRERSLNGTMEFLMLEQFDKFRKNEQFREQWERLTRKKAEIEEYWHLRHKQR